MEILPSTGRGPRKHDKRRGVFSNAGHHLRCLLKTLLGTTLTGDPVSTSIRSLRSSHSMSCSIGLTVSLLAELWATRAWSISSSLSSSLSESSSAYAPRRVARPDEHTLAKCPSLPH
ncbi:unnamed protein product, partial [Ixodes hexagonus]